VLFGWSEVILTFIYILIFLFFIVRDYIFVLKNTMMFLILSLIFISLWIWLHPEFLKKENLSKGNSYMVQIVYFQRKYLELEKERIK